MDRRFAKFAIRGVGKALGCRKTSCLQACGLGCGGLCDRNVRELNRNPDDRRLVLALKLGQRLEGAPRHARQRAGGIVPTHYSSTIWCRRTPVVPGLQDVKLRSLVPGPTAESGPHRPERTSALWSKAP